MTQEEQRLFNDLKKLANRANHRIIRLEKLTGFKEPFGVKQLADKLDGNMLNAWTKSSRVSVKLGTQLQMKSEIKAIREFLSDNTISTVKKVKAYQKKISGKAGFDISLKQANAEYQSKKNYTWIYQYMTESEYWGGIVKPAKQFGWDLAKFTDELMAHIKDRTLDEELRKDIEDLYEYSVYGV